MHRRASILLLLAAIGILLGTLMVTAQSDLVRFAVIGDYGRAGAGAAAVADLVKSWNPDFIITTGDNNYPRGAASTIDENIGQYYHEFIFPYHGSYGAGAEANRFFPTLGNHDWDTAGAQPYFDYFTLPGNERYYDVVAGPVHLFALDADFHEPDGVNSGSVQAQWLQNGLSASTAPWKLVYGHMPPFSSSLHGSHPVMRWPYQAWGATAFISGHDHVYERIMVDEFPYFVVGAGGGGLYPFRTPIPGSVIQHNANYGALRVEASAEWITFEYFSITDGGILVDSYILIAAEKTPSPPELRIFPGRVQEQVAQGVSQ